MQSAKLSKKILSLVLSMVMVFTMLPGAAFAEGVSVSFVDGDAVYCTHVHGDGCAYAEGAACTYELDELDGDFEDYGDIETTSPSALSVTVHEHDADCGYIEAVPCDHEHDEECYGLTLNQSAPLGGYVEITIPWTYSAGEDVETVFQEQDGLPKTPRRMVYRRKHA